MAWRFTRHVALFVPRHTLVNVDSIGLWLKLKNPSKAVKEMLFLSALFVKPQGRWMIGSRSLP